MNPYEPPQSETSDRPRSQAQVLVANVMAGCSIVLAIGAAVSSQITFANASHGMVIVCAFLVALLALLLAVWSRRLIRTWDTMAATVLSVVAVGLVGLELLRRML